MLSYERLKEIERRCVRATPEPWEWMDTPRGGPRLCAQKRTVLFAESYFDRARGGWNAAVDIREDDKVFIAHARQDVAALLAEVRRLQLLVETQQALMNNVF